MKPTIILNVNLGTTYKIVEEIIMDYLIERIDIKSIILLKCRGDGVINVIHLSESEPFKLTTNNFELEFDTDENKTIFILKYL